MQKQFLLIIVCAVSTLACDSYVLLGDSTQTPKQKKVFQQLLKTRPYQEDLLLSLNDSVELNISQTGNIALGTILGFIATYNLYDSSAQNARHDNGKLNIAAYLLRAALTGIPALVFAYRTFNAENIIPIHFDDKNDDTKVNEEIIS